MEFQKNIEKNECFSSVFVALALVFHSGAHASEYLPPHNGKCFENSRDDGRAPEHPLQVDHVRFNPDGIDRFGHFVQ
jgi:hypothetical protein